MFNIQQVIMERPSYKGNSPSAPGSASHSALFMKDVFFPVNIWFIHTGELAGEFSGNFILNFY